MQIIPSIEQANKKSLKQKGSLSLSMLFNTVSGLGFVLMMYNLSTYVGSLGVINESARATARCLTPTDPACVEVLTNPSGTGIELDWFGRRGAGPVADVSVRTFKYTASMQTDTYASSFNTYRANAGTQNFTTSFTQVPLKTFTAYGQYEIPSGIKNASYIIPGRAVYKPLHNPNFPRFEQDQSSSLSSWKSKNSHFANSSTLSKNSSNVRPQGNNEFNTNYIQVPKLDSNATVRSCQDTTSRAGDSGDNCLDFAYVSVKAFAQVRATTGTTEVKWGDEGAIDGLKIEIRNAKNKLIKTRSLGGQAKKEIGTNSQWYNLWLRGPSGSHGGKGSNHSSIRVPRGGSFRLSAFVKNLGENPADINIQILTYVDSYNKKNLPDTTVSCEETNYTGFDQSSCDVKTCTPINCTEDYCASKKAFKKAIKSGQITPTPASCDTEQTSATYTCTESAQTTPGSSEVIYTSTQAVCSDTWQPNTQFINAELASNNQTEKNQTLCSWQEVQSGTTQVGSANNCPLASPTSQESACQDPYVENGTKPTESNCTNLTQLTNQIRANTIELNNNQLPSAPQFNTEPSHSFASNLSDIREHSFWTNKDLQGANLPSTRTTVSHQLTHANKSFVKTTGLSDSPSQAEIASLIQSSSLNIEHNSDSFNTNLQNLVSTSLLSRENYKIENTYPFDEEQTEEIYFGQTDASAGWDFQQDCTTDTACEDDSLSTFDSTEQMLRSFAASQVSQANDTDYIFNSNAELVGFKEIGQFTASNPPSFAQACYPTRVVCSTPLSAQDEIIALGRFSERPQACDTYSSCYAEIPRDIELDIAQNQEIIDTELAKQAGLLELRRIAPSAYINELCTDEPGCTEINIDTSSPDKAIVQVSYNMPISFPLSSILQKNSIKLSYTKEEKTERNFAGNTL